MSKFTLSQRKFPMLGLRSQQPKNYVGPTLSCYLGMELAALERLKNRCFMLSTLERLHFLILQVTRTTMISRTSSKFGQIGLRTVELTVLERLEKSP